LKFLTRGLFALVFTLFFQTALCAEYLYKDEIIHNPKFTKDIEALGSELYQKSGISLKLIMLKELPDGLSIVEYEKSLIKEFKEPTVLLTFSEMNSKVDILASDLSLYKYFDKRQVLSPVASAVQAFFMALFYSDSIDGFLDASSNYGGTIIPLLAQKAKNPKLYEKKPLYEETKEAYIHRIKLNGAEAKNINFTIKDHVLSIDMNIKVEHKDKNSYYASSKYFFQSYSIPSNVEESKIKNLVDGDYFVIIMPKK